jgi:DNA-binding MarR family transcriptional regulator
VRDAGAKQVAAQIASQCLGLRVRRLGRLVTRIYDAVLAGDGITIAQLNLLAAIALAGPARPTDLVGLLDLEKSTLSRDLKGMERLGWISGAPAPAGRGRLVAITPAGSRLLAKVRPAWEKAQATAMAELGRGPFGQLQKLLPGATPAAQGRAQR